MAVAVVMMVLMVVAVVVVLLMAVFAIWYSSAPPVLARLCSCNDNAGHVGADDAGADDAGHAATDAAAHAATDAAASADEGIIAEAAGHAATDAAGHAATDAAASADEGVMAEAAVAADAVSPPSLLQMLVFLLMLSPLMLLLLIMGKPQQKVLFKALDHLAIQCHLLGNQWRQCVSMESAGREVRGDVVPAVRLCINSVVGGDGEPLGTPIT
jgi:hypothetical protein